MSSKKIILACIILISIFSCDSDESKIHFYHWKINANLSDIEKKVLKTTHSEKVYLHYFDIVLTKKQANPISVIREVDTVLKSKTIIPVVFIRNTVFKNKEVNINQTVEQVFKLVSQIHKHHFNKKPSEIQIDCDWSGSTKDAYFKFLKLLSEHVKISATIRLHQIKYAEQTGIPPVSYGALMLYNVGELKNFEQNSILNHTIVSQYINIKTEYPLLLDVALPLFSQVVVKNNEGDLRLINHAFFEDFKNDTIHFERKSETLYTVKQKILYKGQYLYKGFTIKLENSNLDDILKSNQTVKNSQLKTRNTLFFHLDEITLKQFNFKELLEQL